MDFEKADRWSAQAYACFGSRKLPGATKTLVAKKVDSQRILFQKTLSAFKKVINIR